MIMTETLAIAKKLTAKSRLPEVDFSNIKFGHVFTDHMFVAKYEEGQWGQFSIQPYGPLEMSPAMSALHYGQSVFEGMKAYRQPDGEIKLFRPEKNWERINMSAHRLAMPSIPEEVFMQGLMELIKVDAAWVPNAADTSLYIRPFMFATDAYVGIRPSDTYYFVIICSPVTGYYTEPVKVKIETKYTRACPGGTGAAKAAGNYAGAIYPAEQAKKEGYHQLLWTDSTSHEYFEESGTMNLFFMIDDVLLTPRLSDTILPGITRDSVLTLMKEWGLKVEERRISVKEVLTALNEGRLQDAFGVGTAATVAPISGIGFEGNDWDLAPVAQRPMSTKLKAALDDIRYGKSVDIHNWMVPVELD